ncbi:MAG: tRNA guanosine(34) transglycosylase Tgt [Candidatus Sumerlaeia bacterium]|nr:tRNA guanosine(34) transglycosylase Tgt [Candidatus Sumerlaeia bacterium]
MNAFSFQLHATDGAARRGTFHTPHGPVETPCFMPVGTRGTVKGILPRDLKAMGAHMILANTFHLHLRPGEETVERLGGLHGFMRYDGPILTDSGGFQVWSLAELRKIGEDGVRFRSPIDGAPLFLSPERSMEIQRALGANVVMAFDECPSADLRGESLTQSTDLTLRWLDRCLSVALKPHQTLFPIVQGGMDPELRASSARRTLAIAPAAAGYAVGGLAVGEPKETTYRMLQASVAELPAGRPRYMMGIGTPEDLVLAVDRGVDLFDCVLPTRNARNAKVFSSAGPLNLRNAKWADDPSPIDPACDCEACAQGFSRGYLRHLQLQDEMLGGILCSLHNLRTLIRQCEEMRAAIVERRWESWKSAFFEGRPAPF